MTIFACVGTYDDTLHSGMSIRGNGKTLTATYYGYQEYLEGKEVYSNYHTSFSKLYTMNELIELFKNDKLSNVVILMDEAQVYLSNQGAKKKVVNNLIGLFIAQTRKRNVDIYLTTQRFNNLHNQLRLHTDIILLPVKTHADGSICRKNLCKEPHYIHVFMSTEEDELVCLKADEVGQLYNSDEIVLDTFYLEEEEKPTKKKKKETLA